MMPGTFSRLTVPLCFIIFILFHIGAESGAESKPFSYYRPITERSLFKPLWGKAAFTPAVKIQTYKEKKKISAGLKRLKADLKLSGIVFNGKCYQAIIESRRKDADKLFYKEGDIVQEARVMSIDGNKLEVILDFKGESLTLNLMSAVKGTEGAEKPEKPGKPVAPGGSQKKLAPSSKFQRMLKSIKEK